jgi:hypothetical protein
MGWKQKKFLIPGGGVFVPWQMLNGDAYKALSPSAGKALPLFLGKAKFGKSSGIAYGSPEYYRIEFVYSYAEARQQGFASATFFKIIQELVKKGFIDPVVRGGMRGAGLSYTYFTLSLRWIEYGKSGFESIDFRTFVPKPRKKNKKHTYPFHSPEDLKNSFPTSECEINNTRKGNSKGSKGIGISQNDVVGAKTA